MTSRNRLFVGAAVLAAVIVCFRTRWENSSGEQKREPLPKAHASHDWSAESSRPGYEQREPVGWVFGRLMGFPGAKRPLNEAVGPGNRLPPPPTGAKPSLNTHR